MNYIFNGKESYFINRRINRLINEYFGENEDKNVISFDYLKDGIIPFLDELNQMSLGLFSKKIVILRNADFLSIEKRRKEIKAKEAKELEEFLKMNDENIVSIFVTSSPTLLKGSSFVSLIEQNGKIFTVQEVTKDEFINYMTEFFKKRSYKIDLNTTKYLYTFMNNDFYAFHNEAQKLMMYKKDTQIIEIKDVDAICSKIIDGNFFDFSNAIVDKDRKRIFDLYEEYKKINVEPVTLIYGLVTNFIFYDEVLSLSKKKLPSQEIAEILGVNLPRVKAVLYRLKNFKIEEVRDFLENLYLLDKDIKTGKVDRFLGLELLLLKI